MNHDLKDEGHSLWEMIDVCIAWHCNTYLDDILNLEISKKKFHPSIQHNGGRKMEVKNQKISTPKWFKTQTRFSKIIILWLTNHTCHSPKWHGPILEVKASLRGTPTHIKSTLRYQKKFYTRHMSHMGACFWKWKIQKIGPPKSFSIQTGFSKVINL